MDIYTYHKKSKLPLKALRWMMRQGIIADPLTSENMTALQLIEKVWCRKEIIRMQMRKFSKPQRVRFISTVDLETKWERYAYGRLINIPPGEYIRMENLIDEIQLTFDFRLRPAHIRRLYKVKQKVYYQRKKEKKLVNSTHKEKET